MRYVSSINLKLINSCWTNESRFYLICRYLSKPPTFLNNIKYVWRRTNGLETHVCWHRSLWMYRISYLLNIETTDWLHKCDTDTHKQDMFSSYPRMSIKEPIQNTYIIWVNSKFSFIIQAHHALYTYTYVCAIIPHGLGAGASWW